MKNICFQHFPSLRANKKNSLIFLVICFFSYNSLLAQNLNIGIITDYKYEAKKHGNLKGDILKEISQTIGSSVKVNILDENVVFADNDSLLINDTYNQLIKSCDVVILIGLTSTHTILSTNTISVPTIALGISNTEMQNIPITQNGTSGKNNFSYILTRRNIEKELEHFYEIFPFKKISILFNKNAIGASNERRLKQKISALSSKFNCIIYPVVIDEDITNALSKIPDDTDALLLGSSYNISSQDLKKVIDYLKLRKIPSYSPLQAQVESGVLVGVSPEKDATSIYRKLGLMIDEIQNGVNAKDLQVTLGRKKQLYFNLETSKAINFSPTIQTLFTANLINGESIINKNQFSLIQILEKAIDVNLGVQVSYKDLALTDQEIREAKSYYLPTVDLALTGSQINEEATNEFIGQSERSIIQSATAKQLIYSESVIANIKIQKLLNQAQNFATKQEVNNTIFKTYQLYLNILYAKSNLSIQKENLEALKKNLELAELQAEIGAKSNSDVYRWKSEVANATQKLIEAQTGLLVTKGSLNTFLNNSLNPEFDIEDIDLNTNLFNFYNNNLMVSQIKNPLEIKKVSDYLYNYASTHFPSVQQLEYSIKALERQKKSNNRAFYLPNISMGINQSEVLQRAGKASEPTSEFSNFIDSFWNVGVTISYPLFEGNRKKINRLKTDIQTEQLTIQKQDLVNNLKLSIQSALINLVTKQSNIVLSKTSADNAQKNFEISQELYLENTISIVQFLDAQNATLSAKLNQINAVYSYVLSFAELENSIGFFSELATLEEKQKFEQSLKQSVNN